MATFPYISDDTGVHPLSQQAIFLGVASANGGVPVLQVSTTNAITATTTPLSADSSRVSAIQGDAGLLHTSAFAADAGLFRVSAIGGTAGDRTLVDGTTQTISATLTPISTSPGETVAGLVTNTFQDDADEFHASAFSLDAGTFHVSAFIDSGSVSARSADANQVHVSATQLDAGLLLASAKQGDAGLFRVSAILAAGVSSVGAASFGVSAAQLDAGVLHASAFVDSGSVSARAADANQLHTSAVQGDAGLQHVSAINQDANFMHVSGFSPDASLFRVSSFESVVTVNTGGASIYFTSSGATSQVSTVKSTAGRLYGYHLGNPAGVDQYLQVFNASGGATAGTDTPALTLYIPTLGGGIMSLGAGIGFSNGIQIIGTSTANGQTIGASAMRINVFYG